MAYIKYLKQEEAINELYGLDSTQIKVLNATAYLLLENNLSKIGDLISLSNIASPATIHAAIKKLAKKNLITFRQAPDSRAKYVELTELGLKRFNDLAKAISK